MPEVFRIDPGGPVRFVIDAPPPLVRKPLPAPPVATPLDLGATLGKARNRAALIGIELEGGWKRHPDYGHVIRDGSVFKDNPPPGLGSVGELCIGPIVPAKMPKLVKACYPDVTDETCGLHIHMSFENVLQYAILADSPEYQETMVHYLKAWATEQALPKTHAIWPRLNGESPYCQKQFWPADQMKQVKKDYDKDRKGHRYTMVHYCWSRTKTVEIRVLPMMETPELAISALSQVLRVTNAYLLKKSKKRLKDSFAAGLGPADVYEETTEICI